MKGKGKLILTGQLGDVMKESVTAAQTYVREHAEQYNIDISFNENSDIHVHVPAGAIPKDGPSAGVSMVTSLVSLLTGISVKPKIAMTKNGRNYTSRECPSHNWWCRKRKKLNLLRLLIGLKA